MNLKSFFGLIIFQKLFYNFVFLLVRTLGLLGNFPLSLWKFIFRNIVWLLTLLGNFSLFDLSKKISKLFLIIYKHISSKINLFIKNYFRYFRKIINAIIKSHNIILKKLFYPINHFTKIQKNLLNYFSNQNINKISLNINDNLIKKTNHQKPRQNTIKSFNGLKYFIYGALSVFIFMNMYSIYQTLKDLPNPKLIGSVNFSVASQVLDRNGLLLYEFYKDSLRTPIDIDSLPKYIPEAIIAIEDKNFYRHRGIDLIGGILRALKENINSNDIQGGSTITQQLVKMSLLNNQKTIERKVKEIILALWSERIYSKKEILEMYLNQVPFGGENYGIEQASRTYFNKPSSQLTLYESAFLAGLPRSPTHYSPYTNLPKAMERYRMVLLAMKKNKVISDNEYANGVNIVDLHINQTKKNIKAPHFVFMVRDWLVEKFGERLVDTGGLKIKTTLDWSLQQNLETLLEKEMQNLTKLSISNGAILVEAPENGEIIALLGSKNYFTNNFGAYNSVLAKRQPGSSIKPILYSLALEKGFTAATIIHDTPTAFKIGNTYYKPVNYDGRFHGAVPLRYALANSYNIPAVKVLNSLGVEEFRQHAIGFGIEWDKNQFMGLSSALGAVETSLWEMVGAYSVFANKGKKSETKLVLEVTDYLGNDLYHAENTNSSSNHQVISESSAFLISDILSDKFARQFAFGNNNSLLVEGHQVAVKTGTSNDKRDNWTIGYSPNLVVGVWVGNNDNSPMHPTLVSGITGAAPIWQKSMTEVIRNQEKYVKKENISSNFVPPPTLSKLKCFYQRLEYIPTPIQKDFKCFLPNAFQKKQLMP